MLKKVGAASTIALGTSGVASASSRKSILPDGANYFVTTDDDGERVVLAADDLEDSVGIADDTWCTDNCAHYCCGACDPECTSECGGCACEDNGC